MAAGGGVTNTIGVLAAHASELGSVLLRFRNGYREIQGFAFDESRIGDRTVLSGVCGVGQAGAAHAASALIGEGVATLLMVGTCGVVRGDVAVGDLVHAQSARQYDGAGDGANKTTAWADPTITAMWQGVTAGVAGVYVATDQPVKNRFEARRLGLSGAMPVVADTQTAAFGAVATQAGIPWAALRAVTNREGAGAQRSDYSALAAASVPQLIESICRPC